MMTPEIIYEDEDLYVCYKPAGMATQTASVTRPDMISFLRNYRASQGQETYIGVIHRLDQPVEGLVIFAKNKKAAVNLTKQVQEHQVQKQYLCIVTNLELPSQGTLEDYLIKDSKNQIARTVAKDTPQCKRAKLSYQALETVDDKRLLEVSLETGRFHQIRCQFANQDAPLLGDQKYGGESNAGLCLMSHRICFYHPRTRKDMDFSLNPRGTQFQKFHCLQDVSTPTTR